MSSQVQVLLLEDQECLGKKGEVASVHMGYWRNFLFPRGKAVKADRNTLRRQSRLREERAIQEKKEREEAQGYVEKIRELKLTKSVKVDQMKHLYGSVTAADICDLLKEEGISLSKRCVKLPQPIKELGEYAVSLHLHEGIEAKVKVQVIEEE